MKYGRLLVIGCATFIALGVRSNASEVTQRICEYGTSATPCNFLSWALRPDAAAAIYVLEPSREPSGLVGAGPAALIYQNFGSGEIVRLPQEVPSGERSLNVQPRWSPDGSKVAYVLPVGGRWQLHVWSPSDKSDRVFRGRDACGHKDNCLPALEWSPDSQVVYFLSPMPARGGGTARAGGKEVFGLDLGLENWREILFADPGNSGVTLREFHGPEKKGADRMAGPYDMDVDVVSADIRSGVLAALLTGAQVNSLRVAPDGHKLLAIAASGNDANVRQSYSAYYVVHAPSVLDSPLTAVSKAATKREPEGRTLRPILENVPQFRGPAAWSPDSRSIAFLESGAIASGNIYLLDVASGRVRNLTQRRLGLEEDEKVEDAGAASRDGTSGGEKFNGAAGGLWWSPDGAAIYVLRRALVSTGLRTRLWKISLDGAVENLSAGRPYDVGLPLFTDTLRENRGRVVVPIEQPDGEAGFAELSESSKQITILAQAAGFVSEDFNTRFSVARNGRALFVGEGALAPQEAFIFKRSDHSLERVSSVNGGIDTSSLPRQHRITWRDSLGNDVVGFLYIDRHAPVRPPVITQVYPHQLFERSLSAVRYLGRADVFLPPLLELLRQGYAVFKPDIAPAGNGETCDRVAQSLTSALDTIEITKLADATRAAIIGHSFGGWTTSCVITRTDRFRAAIAVSGTADLISTTFSPMGNVRVWGFGGGQTRIGKTIWDAPLLYWKESPVSGAVNVTTPLLLIHGKSDHTVPVEQSAEMFTALSSLGKEVSLVTYDGADHVSVLTHPDYAPRVISWIHRYLGDP